MTVARCRGEEARRRGRRVGKLGQRGGVVVERGRREGEETAQEGEAQGGEETEEGEEGEEEGQEGAEGAEAGRQARRRVSTMTSGFFSFAVFFRTDGGRDAVETSRGGGSLANGTISVVDRSHGQRAADVRRSSVLGSGFGFGNSGV